MLKYYLDTSTLYNVSKLSDSIKGQSFYSIFGLMEILAGTNEEEFRKRKIALASVINSGIGCDYSFPELLIFRAFDVFKEYEFTEQREDDFFGIIEDLLTSD